jgi:AhpD family alkylhydroperoxidase
MTRSTRTRTRTAGTRTAGTRTARVPLEVPATLFGRAMAWYSRRAYGDVLDTGVAMLPHKGVLRAVLGFERRVARWDALDPDLRTLAVMAAAGRIGCSWCTDFGWFAARAEGLDVSRLEEVPRWRESELFTRLERQVLDYAEAMTATPPEVTDEQVGALREALGAKAFVELTMMVAVENERSRFNSALGLTSQGFKDRCELADRHRG